MARKSRKNIAVVEEAPAIKVWRAALYIRLSVEFNGKRGDSLETQRQIMEAYVTLCPDIEVAEIYIDNGISGQTFERAAFQHLLNDIEAGKIDCVVVKDLSRLGRNTIDTGYYIEKYFPLHQVRFIAVNDQYDSEDGENSANHMIVPLKNMINEAYAADISWKVAAQQRQAMRDGEFVGSRPPYGYRKDPDNCHHLLVNEDTAPTVRQIFQWAAEGVALNDMVKRLNEAKVPTPGHYLASVGPITNQRLMGSGKWQTWTVGKILEAEVYTGDMVQGKSRTVGRKQVPTAPMDWIVVRDTHEALVSREMFELVQAVRQNAAVKYTVTEKKPYTENILQGRVFCGCCGKNLHRQNSHGCYFYRCITNDRLGKGTCPGDIRYLKEAELFDTILTVIRQKAGAVMGSGLYLKRQDAKIAAKKAAVEREIGQLRGETEKNQALLKGLYENFVTGILTRAEYLELKEDYSGRVRTAVERVRELQARQSELEALVKDCASLADKLAAAEKDKALTARLVEQVIERVTVSGPGDVAIQFRFEDSFLRLARSLHG
ncbi:MAG: recombinase family protein [Oscillospiraceae bacterium]|nr:recombinase family protein [Oscillospiraceae bacterium]